MYEDRFDVNRSPCENCPGREHCDGWEAQFCCTYCMWCSDGEPDCENCDPWDI